jgi:CRISPR-associated protein Cmr6
MFWDLFFQPPANKPALSVEIMTPHHSGYLQNGGTPHANESPNPIPFLAIPPGCDCTLYVQCNPVLIPAEDAELRQSWQALMQAAIEHAGEWLGLGAKTAVGYGRIGQDEALRKKLAAEEADRASAAEHAAREAALAKLSPQARAISEFVKACDDKLGAKRKDPLNPGSGLYAAASALCKQALADDGGWNAEERLQLADALNEWLPLVIDKLDRKDDWKDARKKLKLAVLRGE